MMKNVLTTLLFILMACTTYAQSIKQNEVDPFKKVRKIETSFEQINGNKMGITFGKNIWLAFRQVDDRNYLRLKWCTNGAAAIREGAEIIFLTDKGETITFKTIEDVIAGRGEGTVGLGGSALLGLDIYAVGDCSALAGKTITALRIYTTDGYVDFQLSEKVSKKINKTYEVFAEAVNK